jgi:hypothetical protein
MLGKKIGEFQGKVTGQRVLPPEEGRVRFETTVEISGAILSVPTRVLGPPGTVRLGDHSAAEEEIEAAVNDGRPFAKTFPGEGTRTLVALRLTFQRKGFFGRQERPLQGPHQSRMTMVVWKITGGENISINDLKYIKCVSPDLDSFFTNTLKN